MAVRATAEVIAKAQKTQDTVCIHQLTTTGGFHVRNIAYLVGMLGYQRGTHDVLL